MHSMGSIAGGRGATAASPYHRGVGAMRFVTPKPITERPLGGVARPASSRGSGVVCGSSRIARGEGRSSSSSAAEPSLPQKIASLASATALSLSMLLAPVGPAMPPALAAQSLTPEEKRTVAIFEKNTPSVVYITNLKLKKDVFTMDAMQVPSGAGSGFIWDDKGHIVTNYHVIKGASDLSVSLMGHGMGAEETLQAKVIGFDPDKDLAVLEVDPSKSKRPLRPINLGTSGDLMVGQRVYAIGNPFGLDHTLTMGVISGLGREIASGNTGRPIQNVVQTDAAINPGNSGGPVLNSSGSLIGIATAIYSQSGTSSGVGFAIPSDVIKGIVDQIIKYGKVTRPVMGITFAPDQAVLSELGVKGVLVLGAPERGPAGRAGVKGTTRDSSGRLVLGDIITAMNGQKVESSGDLYKILDKLAVGDALKVDILRGDGQVQVEIVLQEAADFASTQERTMVVVPVPKPAPPPPPLTAPGPELGPGGEMPMPQAPMP